MTIRNLDGSNDWTFGSSLSNYLEYSEEVALNAKTRVLSFLNDCFFDVEAGIDYWNLLDYNTQNKLENAIQNTLLQTPGVQAVNKINVFLNSQRQFTLEYSLVDIFSNQVSDTYELIKMV